MRSFILYGSLCSRYHDVTSEVVSEDKKMTNGHGQNTSHSGILRCLLYKVRQRLSASCGHQKHLYTFLSIHKPALLSLLLKVMLQCASCVSCQSLIGLDVNSNTSLVFTKETINLKFFFFFFCKVSYWNHSNLYVNNLLEVELEQWFHTQIVILFPRLEANLLRIFFSIPQRG